MSIRTSVVLALLSTSLIAGIASAADSASATDSVNAALDAAGPAKLSVSMGFAKSGQWADSNSAAGFETKDASPNTINVGPGGVITVAFNAPDEIAGGSIVLTPSDGDNGRVNWTCKAVDLPADSVPQGCK